MSEETPKFKFKTDSYQKKRGTPAMLKICCANCKQYLITYQKDGPGPLLRCYLDRIHHPKIDEESKEPSANLECSSCKAVIGVPMIYEKENRSAFMMRPGFFSKKKMY